MPANVHGEAVGASIAHSSKVPSIRNIAESPGLTSIPSQYTFPTNISDEVFPLDPDDSIPIVDFSLLASSDPAVRSKAIHDLGAAVEDWGFFMVVNHGVPEALFEGIIDACNQFFQMADEEKQEFQEKHVWDPIRYGTSVNVSKDQTYCWRDYLKVIVHPQFNSPHKPAGFSETAREYSTRVREIASTLLKGISLSLGLEENYVDKFFDFGNTMQIMVANYYPPCPQPEHAMGLLPHSDNGLITLLIQNETGGLQVKRRGKWVHVDPIPGSFLVNIGDCTEILSNGKYKSILHRAVVNNKATRISIAMPHGPSLESLVRPAPELLSESSPPVFGAVKYKDYREHQQIDTLNDKSLLQFSRNKTG